MCGLSTPKNTPTPTPETIIAPTVADANVQKAGANERKRVAGLANQDVKTSMVGLSDVANTNKKTVLGA